MIQPLLWQARPPLHHGGLAALVHAHGSLKGMYEQGPIAWAVPVLTVVFVLLLLVLLYFLVTPSPGTPAPGASRDAPETDEEVFEHFAEHAAEGELDIYTCMGLSSGLDHSGRATCHFLPYVLVIFVFQGLLPVLLAGYELRRTLYYAEEQSWAFRFSGFALFLYAIWKIHDYASDECRTLFLKLAVRHEVSWWFLLPPLFGEFVNILTGLLLTVAVFLIFCSCRAPTDLFLSCLAIKFIGYIDTEVTSAQMRRDAVVDLRAALELWNRQPAEAAAKKKAASLKQIVYSTRVTRLVAVICTYGVGTCLAFQFCFAHSRGLCEHFTPHVRYPFCMGF